MNQSESEKTKSIVCCDCGKWFEAGIKNTRTCRCDECHKEYKRKRHKELRAEWYQKKKQEYELQQTQ